MAREEVCGGWVYKRGLEVLGGEALEFVGGGYCSGGSSAGRRDDYSVAGTGGEINGGRGFRGNDRGRDVSGGLGGSRGSRDGWLRGSRRGVKSGNRG